MNKIYDNQGNELAVGGGSVGNDSFNRFNKKILIINPYKGRPSNAYKGQLHCHTNNSDGVLTPASLVQMYVEAGFDFMTITDHNFITINPVVSGIVWMGNSYEDTRSDWGYQHMNVFNTNQTYGVPNTSGGQYHSTNTPQTIVDHFVKQGNSVVSYNHPEYAKVYASDETLRTLPKGISFIEIFNASIPTLIGTVPTQADLPSTAYYADMYDCTADGKRYVNTSRTYASPEWTVKSPEILSDGSGAPDGNLDRGFRIMLDNGHKVFCTAVDDYHRGDNMFNRGWVVAFAEARTKESIWNALLNGCFYAASGVTLSDLSVEDGVMKLSIQDGANAVTTFYGENNTVLATVNGASAEYAIQGTEKYVRAMVQIGRNKAWTQPIWIVGTQNQYDF